MSVRAVAYMKELCVCPNGEMITRTEKLVGIVLADNHQDRVNKPTFPGVDSIAADALVSERQCQRVFASLERKGVIRREYPGGVGRGKTTYYFFVELERKGCHDVTLSSVPKTQERVTEGCHKGDISRTPLLSNRNKSNVSTSIPLPPFPKGECVLHSDDHAGQPRTNGSSAATDLERAVDQVMQGCGFVDPRLRKTIRAAMVQERDKGKEPLVTAGAMFEAWQEQVSQGDVLRIRHGPKKFFSEGHWLNVEGWHWDNQAIERKRNARVGM